MPYPQPDAKQILEAAGRYLEAYDQAVEARARGTAPAAQPNGLSEMEARVWEGGARAGAQDKTHLRAMVAACFALGRRDLAALDRAYWGARRALKGLHPPPVVETVLGFVQDEQAKLDTREGTP